MGNSGTKAPTSPSEALAIYKGSQRQEYIRNLAERHSLPDQQDFYEMFGLKRYQDIDKDSNVQRIYRNLCRD